MRDVEYIECVSILEDGELTLRLLGDGDPAYQYVYRAARGVYWKPTQKAFAFAQRHPWSDKDRFLHVASVCKSELGLRLCLSTSTKWHNVPEASVAEIKSGYENQN